MNYLRNHSSKPTKESIIKILDPEEKDFGEYKVKPRKVVNKKPSTNLTLK
jgi:hypothetical protein